MIYSKWFPLVKRNAPNKLFLPMWHPKSQFHSCLKPPKPNQILKKYLECNCPTKVLLLFRYLLRKRPASIDSYSFLYVLKTCTKNHSPIQAKQSHGLIIKFGYESVIQLQTSLLNVYSEMGILPDAHRMFDEIPTKNTISWTSLISAYVDNQKPSKALQLFRQMQISNVVPDQVTVTVALSACADTGALEMGEWIHAFIRCKEGLNRDLCLDNALINMYTKCGDIKTARRLFDSTRNKDVTTWTSMIVGHALNGQAEEALQLFSEMDTRGDKKTNNTSSVLLLPNDVTFIGVLMACSHAGLVEEGKHHFKSMTEDYGIQPREPHYGCMVDLFCRAGHLRDAYYFIMEMPGRPNAVMWRTLLGACSLHGNIELGIETRDKLLELNPDYAGDNVAMANIYANKGMWHKKMTVRNQIKQSRAPGCSSIEVASEVSEFVTADDDHPLKTEIYDVLEHLIKSMKAYGYLPTRSEYP